MSSRDLKTYVKSFPTRPGVYLFKDLQGKVLYVGKALSLKDRLTSYFQKDVLPKTAQMVALAHAIDIIETGSEFEALLLEARLIKLHRPKYNVAFRDDKSYLYIFISTGEEFPKIFTTHKPHEFEDIMNSSLTKLEGLKGIYFGPFASSATTREVLKLLRRIFPYCQQKNIGNRPCFYSHLGLCHPCPSLIIKEKDPLTYKQLKHKYRQNILSIKHILEGKLKQVEVGVEKKMKEASKKEAFEEAKILRDQLKKLQYISAPLPKTGAFLENPNFYFEEQLSSTDDLRSILTQFFPKLAPLKRIECYDISHFAGRQTVGAEVVFVDGIPEKKEYRRYQIKQDGKANDFASLSEMFARRFKHEEWEMPNLIIVDGGKPQVSTISQFLWKKQINIPLMGLAKRFEEVILIHKGRFVSVRLPRKSLALQLLQQIRDETHRFAITYNRQKRNLFLLQ